MPGFAVSQPSLEAPNPYFLHKSASGIQRLFMRLARGQHMYPQTRTPPEAVRASGGGGIRVRAVRVRKGACAGLIREDPSRFAAMRVGFHRGRQSWFPNRPLVRKSSNSSETSATSSSKEGGSGSSRGGWRITSSPLGGSTTPQRDRPTGRSGRIQGSEAARFRRSPRLGSTISVQ